MIQLWGTIVAFAAGLIGLSASAGERRLRRKLELVRKWKEVMGAELPDWAIEDMRSDFRDCLPGAKFRRQSARFVFGVLGTLMFNLMAWQPAAFADALPMENSPTLIKWIKLTAYVGAGVSGWALGTALSEIAWWVRSRLKARGKNLATTEPPQST